MNRLINKREKQKPDRSERPLLHARDIPILGLIALLSFGFWFTDRNQDNAQASLALIYEDRKLVMSVPLKKDQPSRQFTLPDRPQMLFELRSDATIAIIRSDCPDQLCVHSPAIGRPGQFNACLPRRILVRIEALQNTGPDQADPQDHPDLIIGQAAPAD